MRYIILLPTYNERENVQNIIPEIFDVLPDADILVIDDNSPDGTGEVVDEMATRYPQLAILKRPGKQGLGVAYKHAISEVLKHGDYDYVFTMDADGSHDPSYLAPMLEALDEYDLVVGSRYVMGGSVENWEQWRYMLSKYGNMYARFFTASGINDLTAGFIGVRTDTLRNMRFDELGSSGYAYQIEFKFHAVHHAKARTKEVPIVFRSRREGESKISHHIVREGLKTPLRLFAQRFGYKK